MVTVLIYVHSLVQVVVQVLAEIVLEVQVVADLQNLTLGINKKYI